MFFRLQTDQTQIPTALADQYSGPQRTSCWLLGGGPSLGQLPVEALAAAPIPKMSINLAGTGLLRPNFWTSYDPSARFLKSIYLDAGITKFVHRRRAMDLVPETSFKVCECPNLYFFERDGQRGFGDFLSQSHTGIVDWADSLVQALDILYRLGFRRVYLAGTELRVRPSAAQIERAQQVGVTWSAQDLLSDFVKRCTRAGLSERTLDDIELCPLYHFDERKSIRAAANCDQHYFRVVQYLRLSRRALALAGMELISVTPESRLNEHFPYRPCDEVLEEIAREVGNPQQESTRGLYHVTGPRQSQPLGPMRDFRPHNWPATGTRSPQPVDVAPVDERLAADNISRVQQGLAALDAEAITLPEMG